MDYIEYMFSFINEFNFLSIMNTVAVNIFFALIIIFLMRKIFGKKFKSGWKYIIWLVTLLYFLFPVKLRVMPFGHTLKILYFDRALIVNPPERNGLSGITEVEQYSTDGTPSSFMLSDAFFILCIAIAVILFAVELVKLCSLKRDISKKSMPCGNTRFLGIFEAEKKRQGVKKAELIIYPEASTPFSLGILHPQIVIPNENYSDEELGFIVRHELVHIKRKDIPVKLLLVILRCINWFNPLAYVACRMAFEDMEISCDEQTSEGFSESEREAYSRTILKSAAKEKYSVMTTYLSTSGKALKKRIGEIFRIKKLSSAIPFTIALGCVLISAGTVECTPYSYRDIVMYMDEYPMEEDPYLTSEEWRSCEAQSYTEAGEKIFRQYMDMYTSPDVPDYYRIEDYSIDNIYSSENKSKWDIETQYGVLSDNVTVNIEYNVTFFSKTGNTSHNMNFGYPYVNGTAFQSRLSFEISKTDKNHYYAEDMGISGIHGATGSFHFQNNFTSYQLPVLRSMAKAGLLDYEWNVTDNLPDPDDLAKYRHLDYYFTTSVEENKDFPAHVVIWGSNMPFRADIPSEYVYQSKYFDKESDTVYSDSMTFDDTEMVYCGEDVDLENRAIIFYANAVKDGKAHGVKIYVYWDSYIFTLERVEPVDTVFTPVEFNDSFDKISFPQDIDTPEEILGYMKTPRNGSDFTVLDFRNITEENGIYYAEVLFKGRLDGIYSSDLLKYDPMGGNTEGNEYIKTAICPVSHN